MLALMVLPLFVAEQLRKMSVAKQFAQCTAASPESSCCAQLATIADLSWQVR